MNRRTLITLVLGLAAVLLTANRLRADVLHPDETLKLPSGHTIKVLSLSKFEYSKGVMALMIRYQTSISVDEKKALGEEVDELWKIAVKDVERAGYSDAIISSNELHKGLFLSANRTLNFIYEKGADGKWTRLNRTDFMAVQ